MTTERDKLDEALESAAAAALRAISPSMTEGRDPTEEALLRLVDDASLSTADRERLQRQIAADPFASARLEILREALDEVAAEVRPAGPGTAGRVKLVFHWARDSLRYLCGSLEPRPHDMQPVTVRGKAPDKTPGKTPATFYDFAHSFENVELVIAVERVPGGRFDVQLQFDGDPSTLDRLRVTLSDSGGATLDSQPVEQGVARFAALAPRSHQIDISAAQDNLGQVVLDVHSA